MGSAILRLTALAALLALVACGDPTGPESFGPGILQVDARSCELPQPNLAACLAASHEIDLIDPPRFEYIYVVATYQNPPDPAWQSMSIFIDGELTKWVPELIETPVDPATRTVQGDTIYLGWLPEAHPVIDFEIALAEGDDVRYLDLVADTAFRWLPLSEPETLVSNPVGLGVVPWEDGR